MTEPVRQADGREPTDDASGEAGTPDVTDAEHARHTGRDPGEDPGSLDVADVDGAPPDSAEDPPVEETAEELEELARDVEISLDEELRALQEEFERLNDRHLRLAAEFNNYRRRVESERLDTWARAQSEAVARFLDVLDDVQRVAALDLSNATVEGIMEGIDLVDRKFVRVLADLGAEVIDPVGEAFDPSRMEAMMRAHTENPDEDDTVAQVFQKGYALKGQLVRPARVSVFKHG